MVKPSLPFELILANLERAINHALSYSLEWPAFAERLNNTCMRCEISPLGTQVFIHFNHDLISLQTFGPETVDLVITATPSALLEMMQTKRAGSKIMISGNAALAQTLQQAIASLHIDWEGLLADQIGELSARQVSTLTGKLKALTHRITSHFLADTADYLVDESALLPSKTEVESFYQAVTSLRYAVDRLDARIRRLEGN